jgi:hypothetical protein
MRRIFQRASYAMAAAVFAMAGSAVMASPASAAPVPNELDVAARVQGCAFTGCVQDAVLNPVGTDVTAHCRYNSFTAVYTVTGRGGFVRTTSLRDENTQTLNCNAAGIFAQVSSGHGGKMYACGSTNCVDIGDIFTSDTVGVFCRLGPAKDRYFLIFDDNSEDAGFVRAGDLSQNPNVPACV